MMNLLPTGCYLPVIVTDDPSLDLFLVHPTLRPAIEQSFGCLDELRQGSGFDKIKRFMHHDPPPVRQQGVLQGLQAVTPPPEALASEAQYQAWLDDKAILRTERFFYNRPSWNVASTRHALMGNFQFKGIGITGPLGRVDYGHTHGLLHMYTALYETLMSWHLALTPVGAQRVAALWRKREDEVTNGRVLMLREAGALRLGQLVALKLTPQERRMVWLSLGVFTMAELRDCFQQVLRRFAWLTVHSYEILAPTLDNLLLDGTCIDTAGIFHHEGDGMNFTLRLVEKRPGIYGMSAGLGPAVEAVLSAYHETYENLGLSLTLSEVHELFWQEFNHWAPEGQQVAQRFCALSASELWRQQHLSLLEWEQLLQRHFPAPIKVQLRATRMSRFIELPEVLQSIHIEVPGPAVRFDAFQRCDQIFLACHDATSTEPSELAQSILRVAHGTRP